MSAKIRHKLSRNMFSSSSDAEYVQQWIRLELFSRAMQYQESKSRPLIRGSMSGGNQEQNHGQRTIR